MGKPNTVLCSLRTVHLQQALARLVQRRRRRRALHEVVRAAACVPTLVPRRTAHRRARAAAPPLYTLLTQKGRKVPRIDRVATPILTPLLFKKKHFLKVIK